MPIWIEIILRSLGLFLGTFFTMRWGTKTPGIVDTVFAVIAILLGVILSFLKI